MLRGSLGHLYLDMSRSQVPGSPLVDGDIRSSTLTRLSARCCGDHLYCLLTSTCSSTDHPGLHCPSSWLHHVLQYLLTTSCSDHLTLTSQSCSLHTHIH